MGLALKNRFRYVRQPKQNKKKYIHDPYNALGEMSIFIHTTPENP